VRFAWLFSVDRNVKLICSVGGCSQGIYTFAIQCRIRLPISNNIFVTQDGKTGGTVRESQHVYFSLWRLSYIGKWV
jgi:hypothetical protein